MEGFLFALTLLGALGCGMMAGVFFAFSATVLPVYGVLGSYLGVTMIALMRRARQRSMVYSLRNTNVA